MSPCCSPTLSLPPHPPLTKGQDRRAARKSTIKQRLWVLNRPQHLAQQHSPPRAPHPLPLRLSSTPSPSPPAPWIMGALYVSGNCSLTQVKIRGVKVQSQCHSISDVGKGDRPYLWVEGDKTQTHSILQCICNRNQVWAFHKTQQRKMLFESALYSAENEVLKAQALSGQTWDPVPELQTLVKTLYESRVSSSMETQEMEQFYHQMLIWGWKVRLLP